MKTRILYFAFALLCESAFAQGTLTPPGPPGATMRTLDQIDAKLDRRIAITNAPYNITQRGSYYLATNLTAPAADYAIGIFASDVTLDLNGFTVAGIASSTAGILISTTRTNVAVFNGVIRNIGAGEGISGFEGANSRFERLQFFNNLRGLRTGYGAIVRDCLSSGNSDRGFWIEEGSTVTDCVARSNGNIGFSLAGACVIYRCAAVGNSGVGIAAGEGCTISDCTAKGNNVGISTGTGPTIVNCTVRANTTHGINCFGSGTIRTCTATGNGGVGILAGSGTMISECASVSNGNDGIQAGASAMITKNHCYNNGTGTNVGAGIKVIFNGSRVEGNNVVANDLGIEAQAGNLIVGNSAQLNSANTSNFVFSGGNSIGPTNTNSGVVTNHPWANFAY